MKTRLDRQTKLVVLDKEVFPTAIVKGFNELSKEQLAQPQVHPQNWNMKSMLEGTRYITADGKQTGNESSIFKEVDRISNKELF